jgi:hypothetical protein
MHQLHKALLDAQALTIAATGADAVATKAPSKRTQQSTVGDSVVTNVEQWYNA